MGGGARGGGEEEEGMEVDRPAAAVPLVDEDGWQTVPARRRSARIMSAQKTG